MDTEENCMGKNSELCKDSLQSNRAYTLYIADHPSVAIYCTFPSNENNFSYNNPGIKIILKNKIMKKNVNKKNKTIIK